MPASSRWARRRSSASAGYFAGLVAKYGIIDEPVIALLFAGVVAAALGFVTSFLVLRGSDLTRLMVTLGVSLMLGEVANRYSDITGGADGLQGVDHRADPWALPFRSVRPHRLHLLPDRAVCLLPGGTAHRLLAVRPVAARASRAIRCAPRAVGIPVKWRLVAIYTAAAGFAGIAGALLTQTTAFCSLDVLSLERSADLLLVLIIGGTGYLYGGLIGAVIYKFLQDWIATLTPQYWQFWIGLVLVAIVLIGRDRMDGWITRGARGAGAARSARAVALPRCARPRRAGPQPKAAPSMPILQTIGLEKRFGGIVATNNVNRCGRKGRAPCPDRAERRRQDHGHQSADRRAQADRRPHPARRPGHYRPFAARAGAARHGAHLPDQPIVPRSHAAGDRSGSRSPSGSAPAPTGGGSSAPRPR